MPRVLVLSPPGARGPCRFRSLMAAWHLFTLQVCPTEFGHAIAVFHASVGLGCMALPQHPGAGSAPCSLVPGAPTLDVPSPESPVFL